MSVNDPMRWSIWSDLLLFLDEKKFNPLYFLEAKLSERLFGEDLKKKKTKAAGRSLACSLEAGGNTLCIHQWHHEFLFWNLLLSSSAGLRCQPVRAGLQNTKWGMGHYTSKGRGRHGSLPEEHAVQRTNFEETGSHQKSPRVLHSPSARGHFTFHWQLLSANLSPISWRTTPSPSLLLPKPLSSPIPARRNSSQPETDFQGATRAAHLRVRLSWDRRTRRDARLRCLGKHGLGAPRQHSTPSAFPKVSVRKLFFFPFSIFWVLISSNKNNEFLKPTRMWQGVNKADQEGDVWPLGCSSHKSLHKPELQRMSFASRVQRASSLHPQTGTHHTQPLPAPSLECTCHPCTNKLACSRVKFFSFCGKYCSYMGSTV